jgi:hypothetical protein
MPNDDDDPFLENSTSLDDFDGGGRRSANIAFLLLLPMVAIWYVFLIPGKIILWKQYYFPSRGKVYATGRRYKGGSLIAFVYSIQFWLFIGIVAAGFIYAKKFWIYDQKLIASRQNTVTAVQQPLSQSVPAPPTQTTTFSLPNCRDPMIIQKVQEIVANNEKIPDDQVEVQNISQSAVTQISTNNICDADIGSEKGDFKISYVLTWQNQALGKWYLEVYHAQ